MVAYHKSIPAPAITTTSVKTTTTTVEKPKAAELNTEKKKTSEAPYSGPSIHDLNHDFGSFHVQGGFGARMLDKIKGIGQICAAPYQTARHFIGEMFNSKHYSAQARGATHSLFSSYAATVAERFQADVAQKIEVSTARQINLMVNHVSANVTARELKKQFPEQLGKLSGVELQKFASSLREEILRSHKERIDALTSELKKESSGAPLTGKVRAELALKFKNGLLQIERELLKDIEYKKSHAVDLYRLQAVRELKAKVLAEEKSLNAKIEPEEKVRREAEKSLLSSFKNPATLDSKDSREVGSRPSTGTTKDRGFAREKAATLLRKTADVLSGSTTRKASPTIERVGRDEAKIVNRQLKEMARQLDEIKRQMDLLRMSVRPEKEEVIARIPAKWSGDGSSASMNNEESGYRLPTSRVEEYFAGLEKKKRHTIPENN